VSIFRLDRALTPRSRAAASICRTVDGGRRQREAVAEEQRDLITRMPPITKIGSATPASRTPPLLEEGDAEPAPRPARPVAGDLDEAVAVGVGLDDRHDAPARRRFFNRP